jgi:hypothetical protein
MCFCTPTIRTPFCDNCNQAMFIRINELKQQRDELERACSGSPKAAGYIHAARPT